MKIGKQICNEVQAITKNAKVKAQETVANSI